MRIGLPVEQREYVSFPLRVVCRGGQRKWVSHLIGEEPLVVDACEASDGDGNPQHEHEVVGVGRVDGGRLVDVRDDVRSRGDLGDCCARAGREGACGG